MTCKNIHSCRISSNNVLNKEHVTSTGHKHDIMQAMRNGSKSIYYNQYVNIISYKLCIVKTNNYFKDNIQARV